MPQYTNQERKGIIMLLVIGFILLVGPQLYLHYKISQQEPLIIENVGFDTIAKPLQGSGPYSERSNWEDWDKIDSTEINPYKIKKKFDFNPNKISYDSLLQLGFTPLAARTLTKAREGGYIFRKIDDVLKISNIDQELVQSLRSNIQFDPPITKTYENEQLYPKKPIEPIEINSADSSQWEQLPNIGPVSIYKIYKHKNALGGFISINQLVDDKIINDTIFAEIKPYLSVDISKVKKININKAVYRELIKHPYFDTKSINAIVNYREQHGDFKNTKDIRKIISLHKSVGEKILPYLSIE